MTRRPYVVLAIVLVSLWVVPVDLPSIRSTVDSEDFWISVYLLGDVSRIFSGYTLVSAYVNVPYYGIVTLDVDNVSISGSVGPEARSEYVRAVLGRVEGVTAEDFARKVYRKPIPVLSIVLIDYDRDWIDVLEINIPFVFLTIMEEPAIDADDVRELYIRGTYESKLRVGRLFIYGGVAEVYLSEETLRTLASLGYAKHYLVPMDSVRTIIYTLEGVDPALVDPEGIRLDDARLPIDYTVLYAEIDSAGVDGGSGDPLGVVESGVYLAPVDEVGLDRFIRDVTRWVMEGVGEENERGFIIESLPGAHDEGVALHGSVSVPFFILEVDIRSETLEEDGDANMRLPLLIDLWYDAFPSYRLVWGSVVNIGPLPFAFHIVNMEYYDIQTKRFYVNRRIWHPYRSEQVTLNAEIDYAVTGMMGMLLYYVRTVAVGGEDYWLLKPIIVGVPELTLDVQRIYYRAYTGDELKEPLGETLTILNYVHPDDWPGAIPPDKVDELMFDPVTLCRWDSTLDGEPVSGIPLNSILLQGEDNGITGLSDRMGDLDVISVSLGVPDPLMVGLEIAFYYPPANNRYEEINVTIDGFYNDMTIYFLRFSNLIDSGVECIPFGVIEVVDEGVPVVVTDPMPYTTYFKTTISGGPKG